MNPKIKVKSITEESLSKKFAVSYVFMSLVPIILILYLVYLLKITPVVEGHFPYFKLTILLVLLLSMACFDLVRRSMSALSQFTKRAKEIANGDYDKKVEIGQQDELGSLAKSFNKITMELQVKVKELEFSKALLLDMLQKVGTAVTSTEGIAELLQLITHTLVKGTNSTSGAICLLDEPKNQLIMKVSSGLNEAQKEIELKLAGSLIAKVISSKRGEKASGISKDPTCAFEFNNHLAKDSIMAAPLIYKDEVLGVIIISDKANQASFSDDDLILLSNVAVQTAIAVKNFQLNEDAEKTYLETITALALAVEAKDPYSRGHLERVADYIERLCKGLHLDEEIMKTLRSGAVLHDIGKIGIRDEILKKGGSLTPEEEKAMREHVIIGVNIIKPIRSMARLTDLVRHHQEFYDGSGYPDGLKGEQIPLAARILKVCDAYDAMTIDRPYSKGMSREKAKEELKTKSGTEFDPKIVERFLEII